MTEPPAQTFAQALDDLIHSHRLTQRKFAEAIGAYEGNVSRWRRGGGIELVTVWRIADYFGVDRNYLARLAGYPDSSPPSTEASSDPQLDAMIQAEWRHTHEELNGIPQPFHRVIIDAGSAARKQAADMIRLALTGPNSTPEGGPNSKPNRRHRKSDPDQTRTSAGELTGFYSSAAAA